MAERTMIDLTVAEHGAGPSGRGLVDPCVLLDRLTRDEVARHTGRNYYQYVEAPLLPVPDPLNLPSTSREVPTAPTRYGIKYVLEEHYATLNCEEFSMKGIKKELREIDEDTNESSTFIMSFSTYTCNICPQPIKDYNEFMEHFGALHNMNLQYFTCQICNVKFLLSSQLNSHMLYEHLNNLILENNLPTPRPTPRFVNNLPIPRTATQSTSVLRQTRPATCEITQGEPQSSTAQKELYQCPNCEYNTKSEPYFSRHKSNCNKNISNSYKLKLRKSLCPFTQLMSMNDSSVKHTRSAAFKTTQGEPMRTAQNKHFKSKRQTRLTAPKTTQEEPLRTAQAKILKCLNCKYTTEFEGYFSRHKSICKKSYSYKGKLRLKALTNKVNQGKIPPVKCNFCDVFITRNNMSRHIINIHSKNK